MLALGCMRRERPAICAPGGELASSGAARVDSLPAPGAAAVPDIDWPTYGGNDAGQRYSRLAQIDTGNVRRLVPVCLHRAPVGLETQQSTPVVHGDALFYTLPYDIVVAMEPRTGRELWRYTPRLARDSLVLCCGPHNRGVAVDDARVYLATLDARLVALDRRTGAVAWEVPVAEPIKGYSFTAAPLLADGKVILGTAGGEFGIRGWVDAYDAGTGQRAWRFYTVPSPEDGGWWGLWAATTPDGEDLHRDLARERADSARYADAWRTGGGPVWMTPAFDAALGLVFIGIGNPAPDIDESKRPGDNLYTSSIAALDVRTGALKWYHQLVPHDRWDYDAANPVVLLDATVNGATVPAIAHAGKAGWVHVLDRRDGRRLVRTEALVPQKNLFMSATAEGIEVAPGGHGGSNWAPSAYSPRTRLMYVLANHEPSVFKLVPAPLSQGAQWFGGEMTVANRGRGAFGRLNAVDPSTGKIRWQLTEKNLKNYSGGTLATAGDLVFFGDADGYLNAVDARSGARLWRHWTGRPSIDAAPMTFSRGGRQYVAIATQGALVAFTLR